MPATRGLFALFPGGSRSGIPVIFPVSREFAGEWFVQDCLHRHPAPSGFGWLPHPETDRRRVPAHAPSGAQAGRHHPVRLFPKLKNDDIDAGSINDPGRRLACHKRGRVTATRPFLPLSLHSHVAVADDEFPTGKELTS